MAIMPSVAAKPEAIFLVYSGSGGQKKLIEFHNIDFVEIQYDYRGPGENNAGKVTFSAHQRTEYHVVDTAEKDEPRFKTISAQDFDIIIKRLKGKRE